MLNHKKLLTSSSKLIDEFRRDYSYETPTNFEDVKSNILNSSDLREMISSLSVDNSVSESLKLMFTDLCLAEISRINSKSGPLVEFPASIRENLYCKIVDEGLQKCPSIMIFVINIVVRRGEPVLPSHVLKVATLFSSICYAGNQDLDSLVKLRGLTLQVDGLSNVGLDMLSDVGLSQCARSLSNHRDQFADIGPSVIESSFASFPYQSTIDNCDLQSEHLTVETIEKVLISWMMGFVSRHSIFSQCF